MARSDSRHRLSDLAINHRWGLGWRPANRAERRQVMQASARLYRKGRPS